MATLSCNRTLAAVTGRLSLQGIGTWLMAENMCPAERNPFSILHNYVHTALKLRSLGSAHFSANRKSSMKVSLRLLGMNETQSFTVSTGSGLEMVLKQARDPPQKKRSSLFVKKKKQNQNNNTVTKNSPRRKLAHQFLGLSINLNRNRKPRSWEAVWHTVPLLSLRGSTTALRSCH